MEALWLTLKICIPIIVVGTFFYLFRQRASACWQRGLRQRFLPIPFSRQEEFFTAFSVSYSGLTLILIWVSDSLVTGILWVGSIQIGTIVLAVFRTPFRCFYTALFSAITYLGVVVRGVLKQRSDGQAWSGEEFMVMGLMFLYLVLLPTAIAWIVTIFRNDRK
jgi:hypothetical protein